MRIVNPTFCTEDANAEAYLVAVFRDRLSPAPFAIQLSERTPPAGAPRERTSVYVDLRPAGSTASHEDLGFDPITIEGEGKTLADSSV